MADKYAWKYAKINVGKSGNIPGEITQWSRSTVADGKWMNNEQLLPLSGRDQYLLDSINDVYNSLSTEGGGVIDAINNEIKRAKQAETSLKGDINTETARATAKETEIANSILGFDQKIKKESDRATSAENDLSASLLAEINRATSAENGLTTRLTSETSRATSAENSLNAALLAEITRASNEETNLNNAITAETNRATGVESGFATDINILYEDSTTLNAEVDELNNKLYNTIELIPGDGIDFNNNTIGFKFADSQNITGDFDEYGNVIFDLTSGISATNVNSDLIITENLVSNNLITTTTISDGVTANRAEFGSLTIETSHIPTIPSTSGMYQLVMNVNNDHKTFNWATFTTNPDEPIIIQGIDGKSAYEIAVDHGFIGSEEEWLESLQGVDGKDGKNGKDGINGKDGVNGVDGKDGVNGVDGKDGINGVDGKDGKSAYQIAVDNGFVGTEEEWLESLHGEDGEDGEDGKSAYQIAVDNGFVGTEEEWLESLKAKATINTGFGLSKTTDTANTVYTNDHSKIVHDTISSTSVAATIIPAENVMTDYGVVPDTITSLVIKLPARGKLDSGIEYLREIGFQFKIPTTLENLTVSIIDSSYETLYFTNWPDTYTPGSVYQFTVVNNCVTIGEFVQLTPSHIDYEIVFDPYTQGSSSINWTVNEI